MTLFVLICIALLALIIIVALYHRRKRSTEIYVDGDWYTVKGTKDAARTAQVLADINAFNIKLMRHLKMKYNVSLDKSYGSYGDEANPYVPTKPQLVWMLLSNYNQNRIFEHMPSLMNKDTAFVIDKGEQYGLCVKDKNGEYHDFDTLLFVDLHEMSHMSIHDVDHSLLFWNVFKFYLYEAKEVLGRKISTQGSYCGIEVKYNPLDDPSLDLFTY
jgi:uncharacterized protein YxeA